MLPGSGRLKLKGGGACDHYLGQPTGIPRHVRPTGLPHWPVVGTVPAEDVKFGNTENEVKRRAEVY